MIKIAITGNIAAGKSTVEKIISESGYMVVDTDEISHYLLEKDSKTIEEVKNTFKSYNILDEDGNISRKKLGNIIFSEKELKSKLEGIIHSKIRIKLDEIYQKNHNENIIFVSVPLLFEAGFEDDFDKIILVKADENVRKERLLARNKYTIEHAKARIKSQIPQEEKHSKSDFIIQNNDDLSSLKKTTLEIIKSIEQQLL